MFIRSRRQSHWPNCFQFKSGAYRRIFGAEMMAKYAGLTDYLQARTERELVLTFDELAVIIEGYLPKSAEQPRYWENTANAGNRASRCAGYQTTLVQGSDEVRFIRI